MKKSTFLIAAAVAMLSSAPAFAVTGVVQALSDMRALNLITLGDFSGNGIDVEGKAWIGGNLTSGTTVGIGHSKSPSQSAATSSYSTLTVLGNASGQINLKNGGGVGGSFGATIVGNLDQITINGTNSTINVGGNVGTHVNVSSGTTMAVHGNMAGADLSSGSTLIVGGSMGDFNPSQNSAVSMGSFSGSKLTVTSGSMVYVGSSVSNVENDGGTVQVTGDIGNVSYASNSVTKATGNINGGSNISNNPTYVFAGGSIAGAQSAGGNAANVHQNYDFAAKGAEPAPTTLGTPPVPTVTPLSTMASNMQALSTALLAQSSSHATGSWFATPGDSQQLTIQATSSGANAVAVINLSASAFTSFNEINYNFSDPNMIVIINVLGDPSALANHDGTYNWNMNPVGGANSSASQQIIWNFADAGTLNVNREEWGSILAPYATVANSTDINGSLVAKIFNQGGEVHLGTFDGFSGFLVPAVVGSPAPEPATWAMMLAGFGAVGGMIRRRRRQGGFAKAA